MTSSFGDRIRLIRKTNRLNQVDLSKMIGRSQGTLSELEQDKYSPSLETILSIHKVFDTDLTWFVLGQHCQSADIHDIALFQSKLNHNEVKLIDLFDKLTENDKEEILQFIELKLKRYKK